MAIPRRESLVASHESTSPTAVGLPGSAPGNLFTVAGLQPVDGALVVGRIEFPAAYDPDGVLELREDVVDDRLAMPRDLNGDGDVDDVDHSTDYRLLPVAIVLRWRGSMGERTMELRTLLADR